MYERHRKKCFHLLTYPMQVTGLPLGNEGAKQTHEQPPPPETLGEALFDFMLGGFGLLLATSADVLVSWKKDE
jgi:hypothetical protein